MINTDHLIRVQPKLCPQEEEEELWLWGAAAAGASRAAQDQSGKEM